MTARDKILESADQLFGAFGFDATTTRQIAEASGANKALIHYHFESKDKLFEAVLDRYYERLNAELMAALQRPGSLAERFEAAMDAYVGFLGRNLNFSRMVQREASGGRHLERVVAHMVPIFSGGVALIEEAFPGSRGGEFAAAQLLISFYGMIVTYFSYSPIVERLLHVDPLSPEALQMRRRHLARMLELVVEALSGNADTKGESELEPRRGSPEDESGT